VVGKNVRILGPRGVILLAIILFFSSPRSSVAQHAPPASGAEVPIEIIVVRSGEEAQKVLERLQKGEDFATIAREQSIDPTAENGGYLGRSNPEALRAELRDALKGVAVGQLTPIVHIPSGYAILKIMPGASRPSESSSPSIPSTQSTSSAPMSSNSPSAMGLPPPDPARAFAVSASGTVKYTADVSGLGEAEAVLLKYPKPRGWNENPQTICEFRKKSLAAVTAKLQARTSGATSAPETGDSDSMTGMETHFALAQVYAYDGNMQPAVEQYEAAYRLAVANVPTAVPAMAEAVGIAYLHKSEMENDVYRAPGEKCVFPIPRSAAYTKTADSQKAIEYFLKYLALNPSELEVKWLLNVSYMTIGKYPEDVPAKYLLPPDAFESKEDVGRFTDVAAEAGLNSFSSAGGVIVDDFENNGLLDVVTSGFESCGPMHYFHNNGDGTFTDRTRQAGLSGLVGGLNIVQTDYNNDGCIDIFVMRGAWEFVQSKTLLRNNCDGTFTDVTVQAGLAKPLTSSQAAVWVDINNDGWLDLFIGNETGPAQLFLNKGDGTFEDIAMQAGVDGDGTAFTKGVAAADYDNDGWVDLYVSNLNGPNFLYHNNHDNSFTEVAMQAGATGTGRGFNTWFFDYDNDGFPDIFTTSYFASDDEIVRTYLNLPHNAQTLKLYKNNGDGTFKNVTQDVGLDKVFMPMGANFGDVDNDGYLDIYLGTGNPSYASIVPNVLLRNHDGKYFVDITASSGTGELHKGHGVAFADLDNSGNEDLIAEIGGATPGDSHALRVFKNPGHDNDWITLKLVGVKSNRVAIGARIKVTVENEGKSTRSIYRTVGSGGSFGASPLQQHIGLGKSARIVSIEVDWPASKSKQVFTNVPKNQFLEVKEFSDQYTQLVRKPFRLGAPPSASAAASKPIAQKATGRN
jgi:tetratricopeptide (TPR) repeat protein